MELSYYLDQANIPSDLVVYRYNYNAGTPFNFSANLNSNTLVEDVDELDDYTFFVTFTRIRYHAQILVGNYTSPDYLATPSSKSGYVIGVNSTNELFIDYPRGNFSYTFKIRLGNKNCIAIKKNKNVFTVYKYDIISGVIEDSDSITIEETDLNLLSYSTISIAGLPLYPSLVSSVRYFSGFIDQCVFIDDAIDQSLVDIIFKGFRPETLTPTVSQTFIKSSSYSWISPELEQYKSYFDSGFASIDNYLYTGTSLGLPVGSFFGSEAGYFGTATTFEIENSYTTGIDRCSTGTGVTLAPTANYYQYDLPSGVPNYSYLGVSTINKYSNRMSVSRSVTLTLSGTGYKFDYNAAYISQSTSTGYASSFDYSYYPNLRMDGVFSDSNDLIWLYSGSYQAPTGYHIPAEYNFVNGSFYAKYRSANSSYYLNGQPVIDGVLSGDYIYITGASSTDNLEYDNTQTYTLLSEGPWNYLTGKFYQNSSRVLESSEYKNLTLNTDYIETSSGHMYHAQNYQPQGNGLLFTL